MSLRRSSALKAKAEEVVPSADEEDKGRNKRAKKEEDVTPTTSPSKSAGGDEEDQTVTPLLSPDPQPVNRARLTSTPTVSFSLPNLAQNGNTKSPLPQLRSVPTLRYSASTVLRRFDEHGNQLDAVPMSKMLKSASICTRRAIAEQEKRRVPSPEETLAKSVLHLLTRNFLPVAKFQYGSKEASHSWKSKEDVTSLRDSIAGLCEAAKKAFQKDAMLLRLKSPVYILGDLHGNYKDLQVFAKNFWSMGVSLCAGKLLFLGDYVDRGPHSVELVCYLFALKVLHPTRVFLLRGNHEFAEQNGDVDYNPCFLTNCTKLFGKKEGQKTWEAFNDTFDWLPIAATVDNKIFCCHGGIPRALIEPEPAKKQKKKAKRATKGKKGGAHKRKRGKEADVGTFDRSEDDEEEDSEPETEKRKPLLERIAAIERPLKEEFVGADESYLTMDLLWADPATNEEEEEKFGEYDENDTSVDAMFAPSDRGGDAIVFGGKAMDAFVKETGCAHLIRAHQPPNHGFDYAKGARIITVFSSSHYCGGFNSAAIVLASDEGKLRIATTVVTKKGAAKEEEELMSDEDDVTGEEDYDT